MENEPACEGATAGRVSGMFFRGGISGGDGENAGRGCRIMGMRRGDFASTRWPLWVSITLAVACSHSGAAALHAEPSEPNTPVSGEVDTRAGERLAEALNVDLRFTRPAVVGVGDDATPPLLAETRRGAMHLSPTLRLEYGSTMFSPESGVQHDRAIVRTGLGRESADVGMYDTSLRWDMRAARLTLTPHAGMRAVRYESFTDRSGELGAEGVSEASGVGATPVAGLVLRWDATDRVIFEAGGATSFLEHNDGPTVLDFSAQTGFMLQHNMGLYMGYQRLRATFEEDRENSLQAVRDVVYARFELRF